MRFHVPAPRRRALAVTLLMLTGLLVPAVAASGAVPPGRTFTVDSVAQDVRFPLIEPAAPSVHPDGKRVFYADQARSALVVVDIATRAVVGQVTTAHVPSAVAFNTDGSRVYVATAGPQVQVLNAAGGTEASLSLDDPALAAASSWTTRSMVLDPTTGRLFIQNHPTGTIAVLDTTTGNVSTYLFNLDVVPCSGSPSMALDAATHLLYTACSTSSRVHSIDTRSLSKVSTLTLQSNVSRFLIGSSAQTAITFDATLSQLLLVSLTTGTVIHQISVSAALGPLVADLDSDTFYVAFEDRPELFLLETSTFHVLSSLTLAGPAGSLVVGPRGHVVAANTTSPTWVQRVTPDPLTPEPTPPPAHPQPVTTTTRWGGADRYATNAAAVAATFPRPVDTVYVANGADYPDALTAGPAAAHDGAPLLLVERDQVPDVVATQLRRLRPQRIVVVGGTGAVSGRTASALKAFTYSVSRVAGADRYATASAVALSAWKGAPPDTVYLTSGTDYPDALSAGPAAAHTASTVLLTQPGRLPDSTLAALRRLTPQRIVIVGGTASVSHAVETGLRGLAREVTRVAGPDRYATNTALTRATWPTKPTNALYASGTGFADALTATTAAATLKAPLLLTRATCLPPVTAAESSRLAAAERFLIGGGAAVAEGAADTVCR